MNVGYGPTAKILHWLTVSLLTAQYFIGWLMPRIMPGMTPGLTTGFHISIGTIILFIMLVRLGWRVSHSVAPEGTLPVWQRMTLESVHLLLYVLVFATVLTGWAYASARGWSIAVFWVLTLPTLFEKGSTLGGDIGDLHTTLTWILLAVIGMHVAAALIHLFVYRDRVMQRMLPGTDADSG